MMEKLGTWIVDTARQICDVVQAIGSALGSGIQGLWKTHRERVVNNPDYAAAIGAAATAVAALFTADPPLLAAVAAVAALYVAIHHATRSREPWTDPYDDREGQWGARSDPWRDPQWDDGH